ncbi:MAG: arsenic transporter, partial [Chitinophagaceae bacterium]
VLVIAGIIIRPLKLSEAIWAAAGAVLLVVLGLLSFHDAILGVKKGIDVYLFLLGMMLLAETAREEKLFDWLAAHTTLSAKGSPKRLFLLIYISGILVTAFLSNDATAVVLTPAVAAAVKTAKSKNPLSYLFIGAFVANAASFILPISNPANLVIYNSRMPPLALWISTYGLPSVAAITATFFLLYWTQKKKLIHPIEKDLTIPKLTYGGRTALIGIATTVVVLLICSVMDIPLGLPTAITGIITSLVVLILSKKNPLMIIKGVSWSVIPFVAGLFVIVEALDKTGLTGLISAWLYHQSGISVTRTAWNSGLITAFGSNILNNLPAGLIAANAVQAAHVPGIVRSSVLLGVDLGPNLSVTGSLATILWLIALRREGLPVNAWTFLKTGVIVMIPALLFTLATLWIL